MNFQAIDQTLRLVLNAISGVPSITANNPIPTIVSQGGDQSQFFPQVGTGLITDGHGNEIFTGRDEQAKCTYEIYSINGVGSDERRNRYDPAVLLSGDTYTGPGAPLGSMISENTGNREIHVQVTCECFKATDGAGAFPIVERIRTAIPLPSVLELLNSAGLALQGCGEVHTTNYDDDNNRKVSVAVLEIIFNAADGVEDIPQTTIEIVEQPTQRNGDLTVYGLVTDE